MNKFTRILIDGLMIVLFLALLAFPISSIGLFNLKTVTDSNVQVLGKRSVRDSSSVPSKPQIKSYTVRTKRTVETLDAFAPAETIESTESTTSLDLRGN